jgi:predicted Rossmann fold flavoprotein
MTDSNPAPTLIDFAIIGGGAAGFFAAIACAEALQTVAAHKPRIVILEKTGHPLAKVLISGGGRCNVTHACFDPAQLVQSYPRGAKALRGAFTRFQPADTIAWFEKHGVPLKTEADGRVFPASDAAQSVVNCLREAAEHAGVALWTHMGVKEIAQAGNPQAPFLLHLQAGRSLAGLSPYPENVAARSILLATGGEAGGFRLASELGHSIEPPVPSLFTFSITDRRLEGLAGLSVQNTALKLCAEDGSELHLPGLEQSGPTLITHWGLSGPAVLRLSAWGARWLQAHSYRAGLLINWLGAASREEALAFLRQYKDNRTNAGQKVTAYSPYHPIPSRLWKRLTQAAGIVEQLNWGDVSKTMLSSLAEELTRGSYQVQGKGPFKEEFVTCGGVNLDQVNFKTMESRLVPGLYLAGEVLDIDGLTGGFNFQNAWTTGWIAGTSLAQKCSTSL